MDADRVTVVPTMTDGDRLAEHTERAYDATADRYATRWQDVDPLVDVKREFVARVEPNAIIVDLGCGTGRDVDWFDQHGYATIGVDRSRAMLRVAVTVAPHVRFVRADVRQLPFADGAVDAWWASASLLHLTATGMITALREARRVAGSAGLGFLAVRRGTGERLERVDDTVHHRFFRYWAPSDLDAAIRRSGWKVADGWTSPDSLGRQPWLARFVQPA